MKRAILILSTMLLPLVSHGQEMPAATSPDISPIGLHTKAFSHLDLSLTSGSTGIGFDVAMPINNTFSLRAGYAFMPHFTHAMHFGVNVARPDEELDPEVSAHRFNRLAELLEGFTGNKVDNVVEMIGKPTYWNWKLLVDVFPLRDKHWHVTAGIYAGNSQVAAAVNSIEDMPSTMAVGIYNNLYYKAVNMEPLAKIGDNYSYLPEEVREKLEEYGMMSIHMADYKHDIYYDEDVVATKSDFVGDIYYNKGDIIYHSTAWTDADGVEHGPDIKHKKGDPYRMVPDANSMVKAWAYAKRFKPYLGFGYGGRLIKGDPRWMLSFDCGAMFWGGVPRIVTHDGTDLINDVENVRGKVGDYVDIIKKFKVFPVANLRITWRIF